MNQQYGGKMPEWTRKLRALYTAEVARKGLVIYINRRNYGFGVKIHFRCPFPGVHFDTINDNNPEVQESLVVFRQAMEGLRALGLVKNLIWVNAYLCRVEDGHPCLTQERRSVGVPLAERDLKDGKCICPSCA